MKKVNINALRKNLKALRKGKPNRRPACSSWARARYHKKMRDLAAALIIIRRAPKTSRSPLVFRAARAVWSTAREIAGSALKGAWCVGRNEIGWYLKLGAITSSVLLISYLHNNPGIYTVAASYFYDSYVSGYEAADALDIASQLLYHM